MATSKKFLEGSTWFVSKVAFAQKAKPAYISAPIKTVVALNNCNLKPSPATEARVLFGDVTISGITSRNLYFDVLGLIKVYDAREKTVAVLLDDTMKMVSIGVWDDASKQDGLVQQIAKLEGQVVVITGVKSQYRDGSLNLNTSKSSVILQQDDSGLDETKLQKLGEGGL